MNKKKIGLNAIHRKNNYSFIPIIFKCNDNCISCIVEKNKRNKLRTPTLKNIKEDIDRIAKYSTHLEINGGEPTLREDILKIISYAHSKPTIKHLSLLTNTRMLSYSSLVKKLANFHKLKIVTTLYGHDSKTHNSITRNPESFNQKLKGIKNIIKENIELELRILVHKMNYLDINNISKFIISNFNPNNFSSIIFMSPKMTGEAKNNKNAIHISIKKSIKELIQAIKILEKTGFNITLRHYPLCVLPNKLWKYASSVTAEETEIFFPKKCDFCTQKKSCSGIWKSYYDLYKDYELKPIKNEK
ncbi:radical SAM protein [Candidatus Woesearchaeota archaeon]|nr:radical SAM protein [Candidatus Woesearchaeota archaeon]